ncbi:YbaB/EbfC family nucleoid-associated protein [Actinopolymorpha sp. B11F2]|uniref:YbaB/EbfC family nucleoid-associated protein n=1 Tax=Actinopolymorpha sp. B11F2 TaxID=3160862 RepID=UPI0032E42863
MNGSAESARTTGDAHRLAELLAGASVTHPSTDHTVTVTVAPGNTVTSIELQHQARRHTAAELGELIVETLTAAHSRINDELSASAREWGPMAEDALAAVLGKPSSAATASAIPDPPGLDELAAGVDESEGWDDFTPEEWDFIRRHGMEDELHAAREGLAKLQRDAEQGMVAYADAQEQMAGQSATAATPDGAIEVTVQNGVGVTRIDISDRILRHGPSRVGPMVLATIQQATANLALGMAGIAQAYVGSQMDMRGLVERYQPDDDTQ